MVRTADIYTQEFIWT